MPGHVALTAEDVVQLSPKFWQIHRDHIGMPMDRAAAVLLTIQYNLCAGTLAQLSHRAPEVDTILRDVLDFDVSYSSFHPRDGTHPFFSVWQYFEAKKMIKHQVTVFMEERKWGYRTFSFVASLLEGLPIIGLVFTVSNRICAAIWAYGKPSIHTFHELARASADLEKKQHFIATEQGKVNLHPAVPAVSSKSSTPGSTYTALKSPATAPPPYAQ
ncbi:hypothetical protein HWV62_1733 [Athelia sp. TMB]|nr:hypothetical protein HWV62_1733 [Athelia sp. TMB]